MSKLSVWIHNLSGNPRAVQTGLTNSMSGYVEIARGEKKLVDVHVDELEKLKALKDIGVHVTEADEKEEPKKDDGGGDQQQTDTVGQTGDQGEQEDSIERLLAEVEAGTVPFAQLRSRAKKLLGDVFPLGLSPKKDEIVGMLTQAQENRHDGDGSHTS